MGKYRGEMLCLSKQDRSLVGVVWVILGGQVLLMALCLGITPDGLRQPYSVAKIKPRLTMCIALPSVLLL